jgi:ergothioneine biosynthesis protein EgtB
VSVPETPWLQEGGSALADPALLERFPATRRLTEALAAPLSPEDQTVQSMPDASPTKWHLAHTTWFFEAFVLQPFAPDYQRFDPRFDYLFNSYYVGMGDRHPRDQRGLVSRPGVEEIAAYRRHVDRWLIEFLECRVPAEIGALVELGLHHEQQHQELLLMDIHHVLGQPSVLAPYGPLPWTAKRAGVPGWRAIDGGVVEIGHGSHGFSFDNERPRHRALLEPFEIAESLVTNREFLAFIEDDGYDQPSLWMSEGYDLLRREGWRAPMSWVPEGRGYLEHRLEGLGPLDLGAPLRHVSWFEADAFARWAAARLPSEAEWELAAPEPDDPDASDWYGAVWQWTQSPYVGYPGYAPDPGAIGEYNGKFMVSQMVLRGSSLATPPGHARRSYRNFFSPSARWAFAGLRLAKDPS